LVLPPLALASALATVPAVADCPDAYDYVAIADTAGELASLGQRPSLQGNGRVAFTAELDAGGSGIFAGLGLDPPIPWKLDATADPDSEYLLFADPVLEGDRIAFWAQRDEGEGVEQGVFLLQGPDNDMEIVLERTPTNGSDFLYVDPDPDLTAFGSIQVLFTGQRASTLDYVVALGPSLTDLVVSSSHDETAYQSVSVSRQGFGTFAFYAQDEATFAGRVRYQAGTTVAEGGPDAFPDTEPVVSDFGEVAYLWLYQLDPPPAPLEEQVVSWGGGIHAVYVDSALDPLRDFSHLSIAATGASTGFAGDGGGGSGPGQCVAFRAFDEANAREAILVADEDGYWTVLAEGQPLFDGVVADVQVSKQSYGSCGQVAIWVLLATANGNRELVVRADPLPAPCHIFSDGFESGDTEAWDQVAL
jgi:hypothetical protein